MLDYFKRDHRHCYDGQPEHKKHLKCCLCSEPNPHLGDCSSTGERCLDMAEGAGSVPASRTISLVIAEATGAPDKRV